MKVIDSTKFISKYLEDNCTGIRQDSARGVGDWCRLMSVVDGAHIHKTWLLKRDIIVYHVIAEFEVWNEQTIAIPKENWDAIFPKIQGTISVFERETGQTINVEKVSGRTMWNDY